MSLRSIQLHRPVPILDLSGRRRLAIAGREVSRASLSSDLPYVDEHAVTIAAPRDQVWTALRQYATTSMGVPGGHPLARILGTDPRSGFGIAETVPGTRLTLAGRHRFSRYSLVFELHDNAPDGHDNAPDGTVLRATTYAAFPGARGQAYRALVIGSRAHVLATRRMLHAVRRLALQMISP